MRISDWSSDVCSSDLKRVYAFAGIGRPQKFLDSLRKVGAEVAGWEAFPDHHPYDAATLQRLAAAAAAAGAQLVTTAKDAARLGAAAPPGLGVLDVRLVWEDRSEEHTSELQSLMRS